ncbi:MAG: menaquinone biosynthesis decarboxylase [Bacteroidia bacterium]|nr:menaquinone biosynthesis decarboxylase [Bacteroidia bacterium]MDW8333196.1 menaquinone biosynthesis decarboxylase [Bacteroidia bacterium]
MAYRDSWHFIETLEKAGELKRIKAFVNPELEITEIVDRVSKAGGPALLFENTGTPFPLLINAMGSYKRMCMALGVNDMDDTGREIEGLFKDLTTPKESVLDKLKMLPKLGKIASWAPKVVSGRGLCQQMVMDPPDVTKLPVMKCWPHDGGRFITLPVIHTKDPVTGQRNVGLYRMQVFGPTLTALHWHLHKVSRRHYDEYKRLGKKMPVAVSLGGDPIYAYAGTAPLPDGIDEYLLAGFIRKKRVELVRCITQPEIEVPADADIVLEGYVDPNEEMILEGPFGDHTGFYSLPDWYPRFHITAITHRKNAVYPSTIVGVPPQEDAWIGKATERIFLAPIKMTAVPEILDMNMPVEGVFHNMVLVRIHKTYPGQALKVMNALWGAGQMMFTKIMLVTDHELNDYAALAKYVSENTDFAQDVIFTQGPTDVLDHSCSRPAFGGKIGIDATRKFPEEKRLDPAPPLDTLRSYEQIRLEKLQALYPEIAAINKEPLKIGASVVALAIRKTRPGHVKQLCRELFKLEEFSHVKLMLVLDADVGIAHFSDAVWRLCNNADVKRDGFVIDEGTGHAHLVLDGTRKTKALDGFDRDWPNVLVSDDETIAKIDALWPELNLGPLIPSPSLRYKPAVYGNSAVAV